MPTIKNETAWDGKAMRSILLRCEKQFPFTTYPTHWEIRYATNQRYTGRTVPQKDRRYQTGIIGVPRRAIDSIQLAAHFERIASRRHWDIRHFAALIRKLEWAAKFPITKRAPRPSDAPVAKQTRLVKTINTQIKTWTRKQKLAATKLKKLRTKLKRAEKRLAELVQ